MSKKTRSFHFANIKNMEKRSVITAVLLTAFIGSAIIAIFDINRMQMLGLSAVLILMAVVSFAGYYNVASWGALICAQFVVSSFLFNNFGIRDTAMMGLIAILISAGLLAGKTGTLVIGSFIILEIGLLGFLEMQGIISNRFSAENYFSDYISLIVSVSMITAIQWMVIGRLDKNIRVARQELLDRQKFEVQLRNAETRYRNLVERIPLAVYISEPGAAGIWKYVSQPIERMTGFSPQEWVNDPGLWFSRVHPDDRDRVQQVELAAMQANIMPKLEYRLLTRDNREIWVYDEGMFVVDDDQKVFVQGFLIDITERKRAEEDLGRRVAELQTVHGVSGSLIQKADLHKLIHDTGEQIRQTFNANNVLIAIHDPNTNQINFPFDFEDGNYRGNMAITYGEGITSQVMNMKKPFFIHENWDEEAGKLHVIRTNVTPVLSSLAVPIMIEERVLGLITLESTEREYAFSENDVPLLSTIAANLAVAVENSRLQDTLQHELEIQERLIRELELKNAELERFTYTVSHDLKSPLITIRGFLGYLHKDAQQGNTERLNSDIKRISDATEKMHRMLNELLDLSRVGRVANEKQYVPFLEVVQDALQRVEGQLKEKQVSVKVGSDLPTVYVDRERMVEVIQNLVDNASKFLGGQTKPQIEIGYETKAENVIFFVRDNGIGIRQEFHERIFGLFDKLDADTEGTGVGLALVKRIIEVHGGTIWVKSEEGAGTTFYFTLEDSKTA